MFFKSKAPEKAKNAAANSAEVTERLVQQQHSVAEQVAASPPVPKTGTGSCIGSGMWIVCSSRRLAEQSRFMSTRPSHWHLPTGARW
jgi:hypothetical protein